MRINQDLSDVTTDDSSEKRSYPALPTGWYRMMVDDTDYKDTNAGDGKYLKLTMVVLEQGPYHQRLHWENLNLQNPNASTVEIARRQLKALAVAIGHPTPDKIEDSDEFMGKTFVAKLLKKKAKEGYGDDEGFENQVVEYQSVAAHTAAIAKAGNGPAATPTPTAAPNDDAPF